MRGSCRIVLDEQEVDLGSELDFVLRRGSKRDDRTPVLAVRVFAGAGEPVEVVQPLAVVFRTFSTLPEPR